MQIRTLSVDGRIEHAGEHTMAWGEVVFEDGAGAAPESWQARIARDGSDPHPVGHLASARGTERASAPTAKGARDEPDPYIAALLAHPRVRDALESEDTQ